jgi:8-oxo-dGTP diphosphatase
MSNKLTTAAATTTPRIGIAVFVLHPVPNTLPPQFKFIMGRRLGSHGSNTWALPGGHLEHGESFEACAIRETLEETDLDIEDAKFLTVTNDLMPNLKDGTGGTLHYATVFMVARVKPGSGAVGAGEGLCMPNLKIMEPLKCGGWEWVSWEDLEGWARKQIDRERDGDGSKDRVHNEAVNCRLGGYDDRQLFTPMVNLLLQRPGIIPSWSG